jgi:hypothetical protein
MAAVVNVNDLLDGHVSLDLECLDRIYLNAYVPNLQVAGQVVAFMRDHLDMPIPSPSIMEKMGNRFRKAVVAFAEDHDIPVVRFKKGDRHIDLMRPHLEAATEPAVVAIGVAQEFQSVFAASRRDTSTGAPFFTFYKADRRVTAYYFYINDAEFGHGFIKICAYFPYPGKVWVLSELKSKIFVLHDGSRAVIGGMADHAADEFDIRRVETGQRVAQVDRDSFTQAGRDRQQLGFAA